MTLKSKLLLSILPFFKKLSTSQDEAQRARCAAYAGLKKRGTTL
jgi:hypothetical protein